MTKKLNHGDNYRPVRKRTERGNKLKNLLTYRLDVNLKELVFFSKRILKYKCYILTFLHHSKVLPYNNESERAIRYVKLKQKVFGQFKSWKGVKNFLSLRSITDIAIKNKQNVLNALNFIAKFGLTD